MQFSAQQTKDSLSEALRRAQSGVQAGVHAGVQSLRRQDLVATTRRLSSALKGSTFQKTLAKLGLPAVAGLNGAPTAAALNPADWIELANAEEEGQADHQSAVERGRFMARQDRWGELLDEIAEADSNRTRLRDGRAVAEALALGARSDVVNTLEHALSEGAPAEARITLDGIMDLERLRLEHKRAPLLSAIVALTHIDVGRAFLNAADLPADPATSESGPGNRNSLSSRGKAHFDRAAALLDHAELSSDESLLLQLARCALYCGQEAPTQTVADDYARLIDMAPLHAGHMRALGRHMLPGRHGSYAALEDAAQRIGDRLDSIWGAAGYTWVYFDALAQDPGAFAQLDLDRFLDGLADIVEQDPEMDLPSVVDQQMVNLLAAYCLITIKPAAPDEDAGESPAPKGRSLEQEARTEITEAAQWLVRNHLTELHPMLWAQAGPPEDLRPQGTTAARGLGEIGRNAALEALADLFSSEIDAGHKIVFTPSGLELMHVQPVAN